MEIKLLNFSWSVQLLLNIEFTAHVLILGNVVTHAL